MCGMGVGLEGRGVEVRDRGGRIRFSIQTITVAACVEWRAGAPRWERG